MNKKDYIKYLNRILEAIPDLACFEELCEDLGIDEEELELILASKITNITNEELE
jgi:hypothetical protein